MRKIEFFVQLESSTSAEDQEVWIDFWGPITRDEADKGYEDTVKQYPHRRVRVTERVTVDTVVRRSYL